MIFLLHTQDSNSHMSPARERERRDGGCVDGDEEDRRQQPSHANRRASETRAVS